MKQKGYTTMYLMIFVFGTLIIQYICLCTYFSDKENNIVGLYYEVLELIPIFYLVTGLFKCCPVCGKRTLTTINTFGGTRYTLHDTECRNCKSEIRIQHDRELNETIYYHIKGNVTTSRIDPIWETKEE